MRDVLGYEGKKVVITGAATGMGAAAAQLLVDPGGIAAHVENRRCISNGAQARRVVWVIERKDVSSGGAPPSQILIDAAPVGAPGAWHGRELGGEKRDEQRHGANLKGPSAQGDDAPQASQQHQAGSRHRNSRGCGRKRHGRLAALRREV